jgi:hypothetical protein
VCCWTRRPTRAVGPCNSISCSPSLLQDKPTTTACLMTTRPSTVHHSAVLMTPYPPPTQQAILPSKSCLPTATDAEHYCCIAYCPCGCLHRVMHCMASVPRLHGCLTLSMAIVVRCHATSLHPDVHALLPALQLGQSPHATQAWTLCSQAADGC